MKVIMPQKTAHFKSGILFFNLKDSRHEIIDADIQDYDICFVFNEYAIYVSLEPSLTFGVKEFKSGEMYGPYNDYMSVISLHLFGKYDNLISFLRDSFVFDNDLGMYKFIFNGFVYAKNTYDFTANITKTTRELYKHLPVMHEVFEFEFKPKTFFANGAIELFINKLNMLFSQNNFEEKSDENERYILGSANRSSGYGVRRENGKGFFAINLSKKRHMVYFAPKTIPADYVEFSNSGTEDAENIFQQYVTNAESEIINNDAQVDFYKNKYGILSTEKNIEIKHYTLFDNIVLILAPTDNVRTIFLFVKTNDYGIIPIEFDLFVKKFIIHDENYIPTISSMMEQAQLSITNGILKFAYKAQTSQLLDKNDVALKIEDLEFYVDCSKNKAYTREGNIFAINYAGNLLNNIFA